MAWSWPFEGGDRCEGQYDWTGGGNGTTKIAELGKSGQFTGGGEAWGW